MAEASHPAGTTSETVYVPGATVLPSLCPSPSEAVIAPENPNSCCEPSGSVCFSTTILVGQTTVRDAVACTWLRLTICALPRSSKRSLFLS